MTMTEVPSTLLLGFDPGRDKCGIAVVGQAAEIYEHEVVPAKNAIARIQSWVQQYGIQTIIMGNQTTAKQWQQSLQSLSLPIVPVDERYSTLEARNRYWAMYPPKGIMRLVPLGIREVPRPIDDIVAILLVERYLAQR